MNLVESLPVEAKTSGTDHVRYLAESRKRVRTARLQAVSECGKFVRIYKLSHYHWIAIKDVKEIRKGKLKLVPQST